MRLSTASVREESNLHAGATALRAAGLTTCPTHRWGGWRVLPPLRPDAQSGSSLLGSATSRRRTAGRTRTCNPSVNRLIDQGYLVDFAARLATNKHRKAPSERSRCTGLVLKNRMKLRIYKLPAILMPRDGVEPPTPAFSGIRRTVSR